jgi:hypothetical protein
MGEGLAPGAALALRQARHHVPREEREDRQHDDDDCRVLDCRVPHKGVRLRLLDRILLVGQLVSTSLQFSVMTPTGNVLSARTWSN